jgi:hypothetical protein
MCGSMLITPLRKGTGACLFFPVRLCALCGEKGLYDRGHRGAQGLTGETGGALEAEHRLQFNLSVRRRA